MNQEPYQTVQPRPQPTVVQIQQPQIPPEYKPLGAWAYFGYSLLFGLPLIGFIMLCIFALGGASNINLRNYARSFFCSFALIAIITVILLISGAGLGLLGYVSENLR